MIHSVEIAFLFISFKRLMQQEREQIRQILLELEQLTSDTSFTLEKLFFFMTVLLSFEEKTR